MNPAPPRLLHLSDLHFGREHAPAVQALQTLAREVEPEVIAVTGDLTQRATPAQFESARRFLARLPCRHLVVQPGNHDIPLWAWWERMARPHRRFETHFGADRCPVLDLPWLRLVTADSVARLRHAGGRLSPREAGRVARALEGSRPGQLRVVALHHPPVGTHGMLHGASEALQRWIEAGAQIVLAGHVHEAGIVRIAQPNQAAAPAWTVLGGTAVSRRLRAGAPASVNLLGPKDTDHAWLQRWDFDAERQAFVPQSAQCLWLRPLSAASDTPMRPSPMARPPSLP